MRTAKIERIRGWAKEKWHVKLRTDGWWEGDCVCPNLRRAIAASLRWVLLGKSPREWRE